MKTIAFLLVSLVGAFVLLGYLVKAMEDYREQVATLQTQVQQLQANLTTTQGELAAAKTKLTELQTARDQAVTERDALQGQVQKLGQALSQSLAANAQLKQQVQALEKTAASVQAQSPESSRLSAATFLPANLWSVLGSASILVLLMAGYARPRFKNKFTRSFRFWVAREAARCRKWLRF